jgi:hypothetical protein
MTPRGGAPRRPRRPSVSKLNQRFFECYFVQACLCCGEECRLFLFIAFCWREPVSTSLENALAALSSKCRRYKMQAGDSKRRESQPDQAGQHAANHGLSPRHGSRSCLALVFLSRSLAMGRVAAALAAAPVASGRVRADARRLAPLGCFRGVRTAATGASSHCRKSRVLA